MAQGYIYVPAGCDGPTGRADAGVTIRLPGRGPPWIVVDHTLSGVIVARWPGRLWAVRILDAATEQDQRSSGGMPRASANYTRTVAVRIEKEMPVWKLFGAEGERIVPLLDAAAALTREEASVLAAARSPEAGRAHDRTWRSWLNEREASALAGFQNLDRTLLMTNVEDGSPVHSALCVIYDAVFKRAEFLEGDSSVWEDEVDVWLMEPWITAAAALNDAALAQGAPAFVSPADAEILMAGWRAFIARR